MAIYTVDTANLLTSIKTALTNAGVLTTTHYEDASFLIVTTSVISKVIKFESDGDLYFGDAYSSGTVITNEKKPLTRYSGNPSIETALIIKPNVLTYTWKDSSGYRKSATFCKTTDATPKEFVLTVGNTNNASANNTFSYLMDTGEETFFITRLGGTVIDVNNYYLETDAYFKNLNNKILSFSGLNGVKLLMKEPDEATPYTIYGNDVAIPLSYTSDGNHQISSTLLIKDGNI